MPSDKTVRVLYRVDVVLPHDAYAEYTSNEGVDLGMATALGNHLKRNRAGGRIVNISTGEILDEWKREYVPHSTNDFREAIARLQKKFGLAS